MLCQVTIILPAFIWCLSWGINIHIQYAHFIGHITFFTWGNLLQRVPCPSVAQVIYSLLI